MLFPTTVIGSLARLAWVRDVILDRKAGRVDAPEAERLLDRAVDLTIRLPARAIGRGRRFDGEAVCLVNSSRSL
jgi:methionine synthase II (cobalamin-independent)